MTTVERKAIITTVERKAKERNAKAIILESTLLPSFSDALRARLGLPVFDALTLVDYFVQLRPILMYYILHMYPVATFQTCLV